MNGFMSKTHITRTHIAQPIFPCNIIFYDCDDKWSRVNCAYTNETTLFVFFLVVLLFSFIIHVALVVVFLWSVVVYLHLQTKLGSGAGTGAAGAVSSQHHHQQQQPGSGTGQMTAGTNRLTSSCDSSVAAAAAAANAAGLEALANAYSAGIQQFTTGGA